MTGFHFSNYASNYEYVHFLHNCTFPLILWSPCYETP